MNYDITPRTSREGDERNKSHDGYLPYLNAPRGIGRGYSSGSWAADDRRFLMMIKLAFIAGMGGLLCIIATIFFS